MKRSSHFARGSLILLLLAGLFAGLVGPRMFDVRAAPQVRQAATNVVISEFRTRGPSASNPGTDEFIELFNPTLSPVTIGNWEIWESDNTAAVAIRATIPAGFVLQAGRHYLIANNNYTGSVAADISYGGNITDDGGIALIDPTNPTVPVDQVGMSTGSAYKEGTVLAPLTGNVNQAYERQLDVSGSCIDAGNNSADFFLRNPSDPQNSTSPLTTCGNPTSTPTNTSTATTTSTSTVTSTGTTTNTPTQTLTPAPATALDILINEVAWMGTSSTRRGDQWIELYNTRSTPINLNGWKMTMDTDTDETVQTDLALFDSNDVIPANGYFILARPSSGACADINIFTDVTEDECFLPQLANSGQILRLYDANYLIDTANSNGGSWPQGSATTFSSMERRARGLETDSSWVTYGGTPYAHNRDGTLVKGTPRQANWFTTITPTPTRTSTTAPRATRRPTKVQLPPVGRPIISEFLPRPGFDWNQDGAINVFDEFIEIQNIGPVDISIGGWRLDNGIDPRSGSFTLPNMTLKPGQRTVFYASETNIHLSDGGASLRLISSNGTIMDAYTYGIAKVPDQSWCRLPEGRDWHKDCVPTPGLLNTREGQVPSMPPGNGLQEQLCQFPDTMPADFSFAECNGYGTNMWNSMYWDQSGWQGDRLVPDHESKWLSFIE